MINKSIVFVLFLVTVSACLNEYTPDWDQEMEETYIVNSILFPDSIATVSLTKSSFFHEEDLAEMASSQVKLTCIEPIGGRVLFSEILSFRDSVFMGENILRQGFDYKLEILTPSGDSIKAITSIPQPTSFEESDLVFPAGYSDQGNIKGDIVRLFASFDPPGDQACYYETYVYNADSMGAGDNKWKYHFLKTVNNDQIILSEGLPSNYQNTFLFSTDHDDKDLITLTFDIIPAGNVGNPFFSEFYPVLSRVSKDYYLYKKSLYQHLDALQFSPSLEVENLYFPDIFKVLPEVHSNIEGGTGIFAGINPTKLKTVCNREGTSCV